MKRSNITRKTPLNRTKRLNAVSKTPGKHRDLNLQDQYREQWDYCEVSPWLRRNWPAMYFRDEQLDLHHIVPGCGGRWDVWTNMIRVNHSFHLWVDRDGFNTNVIALYVKLRKNELELDEYRKCAGWRLEWWLGRHDPGPQVRGIWEELMAVAKTQSKERV